MSKFLLLLGPSGVGKTVIMEELVKLDSNFVYISPYMTRVLRPGERGKISVSDEQMDEMSARGELLAINQIFNARYATPRLPIVQALADGKFPMLDWPVSRMSLMTRAFPNQTYAVYISPPSLLVLKQRLAKDGRDNDGGRIASARFELEAYWSGFYTGLYDFEVVSEENKELAIACEIYQKYLELL